MQYFRRNFVDIIIFLLLIAMAYLSSRVISDYPGMSISRWVFKLAPVVAIGVTIAVVKISTQPGYAISTLFGSSPLNINIRILIVSIFLAIAVGAAIIFNPFDFIMPTFVGSIIFLFFLSVYMIVNHKLIDAIGLLLLSLPFITYVEDQLVRWETGFSFEWITIKIAIIVLFASVWVFVNIFVDKKPIVKGKFNALILIFVAITFFSAIFSVDIVYSLKRWLFEVVYPIVIYFIIINSIRHEIDIRRFMSYFVASVFLNLTLVLYYFAKYGGSNRALDKHLLHLNFADGVLVANVLIMTIPIVIAFLATTHIKSLKLLLYSMIALGIAGLTVSFARMAQISMAIGLLAFGFNKKTRKFLMLFIVMCVLIFIFNFERLDPYLSKYKTLTSFERVVHAPSMEKRYWGWKAALQMFQDHPLTGVGIGRFNQEYVNYGTLYYSAWADDYVPMISAHNTYLNYLAETGIPGTILLLAIFSAIVVKGFGLLKKADSNHVFMYSLLVSVFVFLINNLVSGTTFAHVKEIDKGMTFWSITAIIMSYGIIKKNQGNHLLDKDQI